MRILLVEDDSIQLTLINEMLTRMGHTCVMARDINEAKFELEQQTFSGVITDLILPTGSGYEVAQVAQLFRLPVVFVTATNDRHNMDVMYDYGFVIPKPISMSGLSRAIEYFRLVSGR